LELSAERYFAGLLDTRSYLISIICINSSSKLCQIFNRIIRRTFWQSMSQTLIAKVSY